SYRDRLQPNAGNRPSHMQKRKALSKTCNELLPRTAFRNLSRLGSAELTSGFRCGAGTATIQYCCSCTADRRHLPCLFHGRFSDPGKNTSLLCNGTSVEPARPIAPTIRRALQRLFASTGLLKISAK